MGLFDFFSKEKKETLDKGLEKTKTSIFDKISRVIVGKSKVDEEVLDELEEILISSDVGVETTVKIIRRIEARVERDKYTNVGELDSILREEVAALLSFDEQPAINSPPIIITGINLKYFPKTISYIAVEPNHLFIPYLKNSMQEENINGQIVVSSAENLDLPSESIDVVVSFETIEHHDKHDEMMAEIKRILKPEGLVIISTPDKHYYSDVPNFKNKFHVKELYKDEFLKLITNYFNHYQLVTQGYYDGISVIQEDQPSFSLPVFTGDYSQIFKKETNPLYVIAIASNTNNFERQKVSVFEGSRIIEKQAAANVYSSNSFKLGNLLLSPLKFLKKKL